MPIIVVKDCFLIEEKMAQAFSDLDLANDSYAAWKMIGDLA